MQEEVDAASFEELGLLSEDRRAQVPPAADFPERADRPRDEHVAPRDLPRLSRDLHGPFVDPLDVVLEVMGAELVAVRAEGVGLDQLRASADEPEVQGENALGGAEVRLFGAAETCDRARHERAHAAVADDRRPGSQPF